MPKNKGMVIATKEEAKWKNVKEAAEERILNNKIGTEIDEEVVKLAEKKIKEQSDKEYAKKVLVGK